MTFLLAAVPHGAGLAAATFAIAAATDSLDGYFARRRSEKTVLGAFLDPLADKLLVTAALVALISLGRLPAWVAMVIIAREFAVSGLRMVASAEGFVIPASPWGKVKTASQMLAIFAIILEPRWSLAGHAVTTYLLALAVVLTIVSGVDYFVKARSKLGSTRLPLPSDQSGMIVVGGAREAARTTQPPVARGGDQE
jgi:CDP-diacylglycerol--glycerol-3-phosphate 3-phosphatidyltransferase